ILRSPNYRPNNQRASNSTGRILQTIKLPVFSSELLLNLVGWHDHFRDNPVRHLLRRGRHLRRVPEQDRLLPRGESTSPLFDLHWKMARCTYSIDSNARSLRGHNDRQRHLLLRPQHPESTVGILTLRSALSDCSSWLHVLLQFLVQEHLNVNPGHGYSVPLCIYSHSDAGRAPG